MSIIQREMLRRSAFCLFRKAVSPSLASTLGLNPCIGELDSCMVDGQVIQETCSVLILLPISLRLKHIGTARHWQHWQTSSRLDVLTARMLSFRSKGRFWMCGAAEVHKRASHLC